MISRCAPAVRSRAAMAVLRGFPIGAELDPARLRIVVGAPARTGIIVVFIEVILIPVHLAPGIAIVWITASAVLLISTELLRTIMLAGIALS